MIGEDAVNSTTAMLNKLLQIFLEILKMRNEHLRYSRYSGNNLNTKEIKAPKIKYGEMKTAEYNKLLKAGEKMRTVSVPTDKLDSLKEYSMKLGAKYWVMEDDGKTATIVIPESYYNQFNDALQQSIKEQLSNNAAALTVKDGTELVPESDIGLVQNVLDYHDIPVYTFQNKDGSYMNIVPSEYDGQYREAMQEVAELKEKMQDIDIETFNQTLPFAYIDKLNDKITEITPEQAEYLAVSLSDEKMSFVKDENGVTAVRFPQELSEKVNNCLEKYSETLKSAEDYMISVVDSHITINKEKLLVNENENEYFTRVPNTGGQDYIKIAKSETELMDGGKTISAKLDFDKTYQIFDQNGMVKSMRSGRELAAAYNTKSKNADKNTDISHYHNDSLERIELFNSKANKLISIGIESADTIRRDLSEQGFTGYAAEKMLSDINKSLPQEYREIFGYTPEKSKVEFTEIKSDTIKQYKLAEKIRNGEMTAGLKDTLGEKCCVLDKNTDKYVIVSANENRLREALETMGYDKLQINAVVSEVQKSYNQSGATLERESVQVQNLETTNAEAAQCQYFADNNGITLIKPEINGNEASFKYLEIGNDTNRSDIETALKNNFGIKDSTSVAEIINCIENKGIIPPAPSVTNKDGFDVARITSDYVSISKGGEKMTVDKNNINTEKICEKFGVTEKQAENLKNSLEKALKSADRKGEKGQTLAEIKSIAKKTIEKIAAEKKDKPEKAAPAVTSERSK
ncbi:MAG: hypothetical protein NC253_00795 [Ruminococcus sp.]|nr:hypothetical protein [Ruminococcus sp.]MCM1380971.1 hypothetical protein [Muribaculaceae bacterium]MCM1479476.1 hypothetical protein [Muribaculaceae bacterium]